MTPLVVFDPKADTCTRYVGRVATHYFAISDGVDAEKIERMRCDPESFDDFCEEVMA